MINEEEIRSGIYEKKMMGTHIFKIVYILVNLNIIVTTLELKYHR
jgi:hypothetical protein